MLRQRQPLTRKTRLRSGSTPLKRSGKLRPVSKKRARINKAYSLLREAYLQAHPVCEASLQLNGLGDDEFGRSLGRGLGCPPSVDIHHKAGRLGGNLLNTDTWMAVSREAHDWIHAHPKEAEARGWIVRAKPAPFPSHD